MKPYLQNFTVYFRKKSCSLSGPIAKKEVRASGFHDAMGRAYKFKRMQRLTWYSVVHKETEKKITLVEVRRGLYEKNGPGFSSLDDLINVKYYKPEPYLYG